MSRLHRICCANYTGIGADAGANVGMGAAQIIEPIIEKTGKEIANGAREVGLETVQAALPSIVKLQTSVDVLANKVVTASSNMAIAMQDAGKNAGMGIVNKMELVTQHMVESVNDAGEAVKSAAAATIAAAVAHPVITTVVIGGVVVVIIAYGTYKIYRYYRPATMQLDQAKMKLEIIKAQAKTAKWSAVEEKVHKETVFKQALIKHAESQKFSNGIPVACQKAAQELAIVAGQKKVDKIVSSFNKYTPQTA